MTFARSSQSEAAGNNGFLRRQRELTKRRTAVLSVTALFFFVYYIFGAILFISRGRADGLRRGLSEVLTRRNIAESLRQWFGLGQPVWVFAIFAAALLALSGFAWLYDRKKLDFYESQPVFRKERFRDVYLNGLLLYLVPFVICAALSLLIILASGYGNKALLAEIVLAGARMGMFFAVTYAVSVLCVMLASNLVIGVVLIAFVLLFEILLRASLTYYFSSYFATVARSPEWTGFWLNPIYNHVLASSVYTQSYSSTGSLVVRSVGLVPQLYLSSVLPRDIANIAIGCAALALSVIAYKKRRNETAGDALAFRFMRPVIKFPAAILAALVAGALMGAMFGFTMGGNDTLLIVFVLIVAAAVICGFCEAVFDSNPRSAVKNAWHIPVAAGAALLIFLVFRFDVFGYDSYLPEREKVLSAGLIDYQTYREYYSSKGWMNRDDYVEEYMHLKNTDDLLELAQIGQSNLRSFRESGSDANNEGIDGWSATVIWHLSNGRTVMRSMLIPYNIDAALMDRIIGTDEYRQVVYAATIPEEEPFPEGIEFSFTDGFSTGARKILTKEEYTAFRTAYEQDLGQYCFSLARDEAPVGKILIHGYDERTGRFVDEQYEVYPEYRATARFLTGSDLAQFPPKVDPEQFSPVRVRRYYEPGEYFEAPEGVEPEYGTYEDGSLTGSYLDVTDPEEIAQLLAACVPGELGSSWEIPKKQYYELEFWHKEGISTGGNYVNYARFKEDEIPGFVLKAFGE